MGGEAGERPPRSLSVQLQSGRHIYFWISRTYFFLWLPNNVQNSGKRDRLNPVPAARSLWYFA